MQNHQQSSNQDKIIKNLINVCNELIRKIKGRHNNLIQTILYIFVENIDLTYKYI